MIQITTSAIPWQEFSVLLDGQMCVIALRQMGGRLYCDLKCNDKNVFTGRICAHGMDINCYNSPDFKGLLFFVDTKGKAHPQYEGLNDRWVLCYETESERAERLPDGIQL